MGTTTDNPHSPIAGVALDGSGLGSLVERGRLLDRLSGASTPIVLLEAPAGYGKSVLLAQWAAVDRRPFASITLGDSHNDPAVLLSALIEALEPIEPLPGGLAAALAAPRPNLDLIVPRLEAALRGRGVDSVLVLDELEHIRSRSSLRLVEALLSAAEGRASLAIATRATNLPHAARLRAAGRLTVLGGNDLVMTPGEARSLIASVGLDAADEQIEHLLAKTEGWPVALYLASITHREEPGGIANFVELRGDERALVDYMRDEFLASADPDDVEFLVRTSFLDRLGGELCDTVLAGSDSARRLADLARRNMLLVPLDRRDEWFRLHSLFAEMLRSEQRRLRPAELRSLLLRASRWWEQRGDLERAVGFALDAGDFGRAGQLIWESVPVFNSSGRYATIEAWLERVGLERLASNPHLTLTVAHGALARGEGAAAEYWAEATRRLLAPGVEGLETVVAGLAMVDASLARGGIEGMERAAARARRWLPPESPWLPMPSLMAGCAAHLGGETEAAHERLTDAARRGAIWNVPLIQVLALAQLALLEAAESDWQGAGILASQARAQIDRSGLLDLPPMALVFAASAYVKAAERRVEEARADLRSARELLARLDAFGAWYEAETAATLAAAAVTLGDTEVATDMLQLAASRLGTVGDAPMLNAWVEDIGEAIAQAVSSGAAELTPAELRVLRLLPTHLSFPDIAAELCVSPNTVKTQARAAYRKLGACSRREAVERSRELSLVPPAEEGMGTRSVPIPTAAAS
jgi:LuxR family maltose regulon positive regulatory protein